MKVSVIMPVYNCREYLIDAVRSVFKQNVDLELIAVDDASTDGSDELLRTLAEKEPRIRAFYSEKNHGVAAVRNLALREATGDYVAFCDGDDVVPDGAYHALLSAISDRDVAIGAFCDRSDGGLSRTCVMHKSEKREAFTALFAVSCLWTKLIRRGFITENGLSFDEDMKIGEDVVFLARLYTKKPTYAVTDAIVYHHLHHERAETASLTHIYTLSAFREHLKCRERHLEICKDDLRARDYIYENFTEYLDRFFMFIPDPVERETAFSEYKAFMRQYEWEEKGDLFLALRGISYSDFLAASADAYIQYKYDLLPRDRVLSEFRAGRIGFRFIIRYARAWLGYKLGRKR